MKKFLSRYQDNNNFLRDNNAVFGAGLGGTILIFILVLVVLTVVLSTLWGFITFIGFCLLIASAFVLLTNPAEVTKARSPQAFLLSPFGLLLLIGLILFFYGYTTHDPILTLDFTSMGIPADWSLQILHP